MSLPDYFHAVYLHYFTCSFSTSCNPASDGKVRISLGIGGPSRSAFESTAVHSSCSVRTHTCGSEIHWTSTTTRAKRTTRRKRCSEIAMSQLPRALLLRMPGRYARKHRTGHHHLRLLAVKMLSGGYLDDSVESAPPTPSSSTSASGDKQKVCQHYNSPLYLLR